MVRHEVSDMPDGAIVTKEEIAERYRLREHEVAHALHLLNLEGLVSQPVHWKPHDCFRDASSFANPSGDSAWVSDAYVCRGQDD